MKLSELKKQKYEVDGHIYSLHTTLLCYRDTLSFNQKYFDALNLLIDLCEDDLYPTIPSANGVELYDEKFYIENSYKEILWLVGLPVSHGASSLKLVISVLK